MNRTNFYLKCPFTVSTSWPHMKDMLKIIRMVPVPGSVDLWLRSNCHYKYENLTPYIRQNFNPLRQNFNPLRQNFNPLQQNFNPLWQNFNPLRQNFNPQYGKTLTPYGKTLTH